MRLCSGCELTLQFLFGLACYLHISSCWVGFLIKSLLGIRMGFKNTFMTMDFIRTRVLDETLKLYLLRPAECHVWQPDKLRYVTAPNLGFLSTVLRA